MMLLCTRQTTYYHYLIINYWKARLVNDVGCSAIAETSDIRGDGIDQSLSGLQPLPADVGRQDDVGQRVEWTACDGRLRILYVQRRTRYRPDRQCCRESRLVDQTP